MASQLEQKLRKAISNAETVYKKAEAYYNDPTGGNGSYPLSVTAFKGLPANTLGAPPSSIPIVTTDPVNSTDVVYCLFERFDCYWLHCPILGFHR